MSKPVVWVWNHQLEELNSKELMLEEAAKFAVAVVLVGAAVVLAAFLAGRFL
jgi:hypothetical protein